METDKGAKAVVVGQCSAGNVTTHDTMALSHSKSWHSGNFYYYTRICRLHDPNTVASIIIPTIAYQVCLNDANDQEAQDSNFLHLLVFGRSCHEDLNVYNYEVL